jgi:hypothetical protein
MGVNFKDVPFGYLRPELRRRSVGRSASRRRGDLVERGNLTLEQQSTADAGENKNSFPAIVLRSRQTKYKRGTDRVAMLSPETGAAEYKNYVYNIYYHGAAGHPAPDSLADPKIPTYPEATLDSSAISSVSAMGNANNNFDLTSRLVIIEFEDPERRLNARIKSVGRYVDIAMFSARLSQTFAAGALGGSGGSSASSAGTTSKGEVPTGGGMFHKGKTDTKYVAFGASYIHMNMSFSKQMGMDRFAWSGQQVSYIKDQIGPAKDQGVLDLTKYTHAFFFTGPNSLSSKKDGAKVYTELAGLIDEVKTHNSGIKIIVVTIQGFSRWGFHRNWSHKNIAKIAKATKTYNAKIEGSPAGDKRIDHVVKWAQKGTIDYGITPNPDNPNVENLKKFSIKWGTKEEEGGVDWDADKLHPSKAGHAEIVTMVKKIPGIS